MAEASRNGLMAGLASVYDSSKYSDLTIRCRDRDFKVHRAVVCPRSTFFAAACDGCFKHDGQSQLDAEKKGDLIKYEATSREISITDDDPTIVEKMIDYLYKLDYSDSPLDNGGKPTLLINAQVYAIAEKYNIYTLKTLAKEKFKEKVEKGWKEEGFSLAIKEVYTSTPDTDAELRDLVCSVAEENVKSLLGRADFKTSLAEINDFTVDLLHGVTKRYIR